MNDMTLLIIGMNGKRIEAANKAVKQGLDMVLTSPTQTLVR